MSDAGYESLRWHAFSSNLGRIFAVAGPRGLRRLSWNVEDAGAFRTGTRHGGAGPRRGSAGETLDRAEAEIGEYLCGRRTEFTVAADLARLTEFQRAVLHEVRHIAYGRTATYSEVAARVGSPKAARAVGHALGRNPVPLIVPCHRIVRSDASIGGFARGVEWKRRLLRLEGARGQSPGR